MTGQGNILLGDLWCGHDCGGWCIERREDCEKKLRWRCCARRDAGIDVVDVEFDVLSWEERVEMAQRELVLFCLYTAGACCCW